MKKKIKAGTTSVMLPFRAWDTSSTTGGGLSGLVYNTASLVAKYRRQGDASWTTITLASATAGTYTSSGFAVPSSGPSNSYELHPPNAALAAGAEWVEIEIYGAANMEPISIEIELDAVDYQDSVRFGLTALPPEDAEAVGGLFTRGTGAGQINQEDNGYISVNLKAIIRTALTETGAGYLAAAFKKFFDKQTPTGTINSLPDAVAGAASGLAIVGSQMDLKDAPNATAIIAINAAVLTAISNINNLSALANLYGSSLLEIPDSSSTDFAFTLVVRDNEGKLVALDGSPTITAANAAGTDRSANLSAVSNPATGRYTFTYTVSSAAAQESLRITCSGTVSAEARYIEWIGAVINYEYLSTLAAVKAKTDNLPSDPADQSAVESAITAAITSIKGADGDTLKTLSDQMDSATTDISAVKTQTDKLTFDGSNRLSVYVAAAGAFFAGYWDKIADHVRRRRQSSVEASSDGDTLHVSSEYGMIQQAQRSDVTTNAGKLTVFKTDGTELAQLDFASSADAEVVTGVGD